MRIIKDGTVVQFSCVSCECEFVVGIKGVDTDDHGENYYAECPVCGTVCHADVGCKETRGLKPLKRTIKNPAEENKV